MLKLHAQHQCCSSCLAGWGEDPSYKRMSKIALVLFFRSIISPVISGALLPLIGFAWTTTSFAVVAVFLVCTKGTLSNYLTIECLLFQFTVTLLTKCFTKKPEVRDRKVGNEVT